MTNFNIKCRLYLCMRKGSSKPQIADCLDARDRQRRDDLPQTTLPPRGDYRLPQHPKSAAQLPSAQAEIAKESKVVATQINVGGRLKHVNVVLLILLGILLIAILVFVLVNLCCRAKTVSPPATLDFVQERDDYIFFFLLWKVQFINVFFRLGRALFHSILHLTIIFIISFTGSTSRKWTEETKLSLQSL